MKWNIYALHLIEKSHFYFWKGDRTWAQRQTSLGFFTDYARSKDTSLWIAYQGTCYIVNYWPWGGANPTNSAMPFNSDTCQTFISIDVAETYTEGTSRSYPSPRSPERSAWLGCQNQLCGTRSLWGWATASDTARARKSRWRPRARKFGDTWKSFYSSWLRHDSFGTWHQKRKRILPVLRSSRNH